MKNLLIITIALLALVVILVALLIFKVTRLSKQVSLLSQPIIHIDVEAANVIAEQLASMTLVETNKYDAISAAMNESGNIGDYQLRNIVEIIINS